MQLLHSAFSSIVNFGALHVDIVVVEDAGWFVLLSLQVRLMVLPIARLFLLVVDQVPAVVAVVEVLLAALLQVSFELALEVIGDLRKLLLDHVEETVSHTIQHVHEPFSPFCAGGTQVDLQQPRVQLAVQHEVEAIHFEAVGLVLYAGLLAGSHCFHDDVLNSLTNLLALYRIVLEDLAEELGLRHDKIGFFVADLIVVLLDAEVGQVLVCVADVTQVVLGATNTQVELAEHVDLQWVKAGHEYPLTNVKFASLVEVMQQERFLNVLLDDATFSL